MNQPSDHDRFNEEGAARLLAHAQAVDNVRPMPTRAPAVHAGPPTLKLGEIKSRLSPLDVSAEALVILGFPVVGTAGSAKLYREESFEAMCDAIVAHVAKAKMKRAA